VFDELTFTVQLSDTCEISSVALEDFVVLDDHANPFAVTDVAASGPSELLITTETVLSPASAPWSVTYTRSSTSITDPLDQELENFGLEIDLT
jgi:hypothetical protein